MFVFSNAFVPSIVSPGLQINIGGGTVSNGGNSTFISAQSVSLAANTITYIFLNTSSLLIQSNVSGFPATNSYPIAIVYTSSSTVTTVLDMRPDVEIPAIGGGTTFDLIGSGTNTGQTLTVGNGSTLSFSGTGVVNATQINGIPITGSLTHAGMIPISQPGNTSAAWADPLVQGLFAPGTNVNTGNSGGAINPVLIGAQNPSNLLQNLQVDASKNLNVNVQVFTGTVTVTGTVTANQGGAPWSQNITQWNSVALGSPSNFGTSPGTVSVIGTNASLFAGTTALTATGSSLNANVTNTVTVSGTVTTTPPANASTNLTQVAGTTLGATAVTNFGTAPAAVAVPGVNASLFSGTTGLTNTGSALDVNLKTSSITLSVSGTVTANQGTSPWVTNVTQFGSNNVVTGTGASGVGIPRVTISNDSVISSITNAVTVSQPTAANLNATVVGTGTFAVQAAQSGTWTVQQGTPPWTQRIQDGVGSTLATVTAGNALKVDGSAVTQPVSTASLPLPANAAQETGGNLALLAAYLNREQQVVDLLQLILGQLQALNIMTGHMSDAYVNADDLTLAN